MALSGIRETVDQITRKYDVAGMINLRDRNRYPLVSLLTLAEGKDTRGQKVSLKKMATTDPQFYWFEDTYGTERLTGSSTVDPDGGNLTITGQTQYVQAGDVILVAAQNWVFEIASVTDANVVVVGAEKGGATGSAASAVGDVVILGNANEEGAVGRAIKSTTVTKPYGYTQIFRTPIGITGTAAETMTFVKENDLAYQRNKKRSEHLREIEKSFFFSKRAIDTTGTNEKRFTQGINNAITTNRTANLDTEAEFLTFLADQAFAYGSLEKYMFCSASLLNLIEGWFRGKLQVRQEETTYGIKILKLETSYGTLNLLRHELLTGTTFGNYGIVVDMSNLTYRFMNNRDTKLLPNRQANDADSIVEEYLSEVGLQIEQEATHAVCSVSSL